MARPRQPVDLVLINGKKHLTKEEVKNRRTGEVDAPSDHVTPPKYLTETQKKCFRKVAKQLKNVNLVADLDCDSLARYVISLDQYIGVTQELREAKENGETVFIDTLMKRQDTYFRQCRQCAADFGLTISSRCRLMVPKAPEKPVNRFEKFAEKTG